MTMIILASSSPRRKEILEKHDIKHLIIMPEVDETIPSGFSESLTVEQAVMYFALKKGLWAHKNLTLSITDLKPTIDGFEAGYIISADTIVYDEKIIGKPKDLEEAFNILKTLKNKTHRVLTGVAVTDIHTGYSEILYDVSLVHFRDYSDDIIKNYIEKESPLDKAGAYAIQSSWGKQIKQVDGDIENVIGLPWYRIAPLISSRR